MEASLLPGKADLLGNLEKMASHEDLHLDTRDLEEDRRDAASVTFPRPDPSSVSSSPSEEEEEITTYISENTTVTSADEEKLLLLNKNTELRRMNEELMRLNQQWDYSFRTTSEGLQHKVATLEAEVVTLRTQAHRLSAKLEHEQSRREYYEQTLFQELKQSQALQEYIRRLEGQHHPSPRSTRQPCTQMESHGSVPPSCEEEHITLLRPGNGFKEDGAKVPEGREKTWGETHRESPSSTGDAKKEVADLKEQLEAFRCQTEIYEAEYRMERKDRQRIKAENAKLRKKEEEMGQQMALLQEQLRIFEDDFCKERSDKQLLQRLLKRNAGGKGTTLLHNRSGPGAPVPSSSLLAGQSRCSCHRDKVRIWCAKCNKPLVTPEAKRDTIFKDY